jgi:hypothetical protein
MNEKNFSYIPSDMRGLLNAPLFRDELLLYSRESVEFDNALKRDGRPVLLSLMFKGLPLRLLLVGDDIEFSDIFRES